MTVQMSLQIASGTPLDLQANGYRVLDGFYPESPGGASKTVTDRVEVWIEGSSGTVRLSMLNAIQAALDYARGHQQRQDCAWFNFGIDETATVFRTKIIEGVVLYNARLLAHWRRGRVKVEIIITHEPFWEGPETQIPLTNVNGTNVTSGLKVYNCNDLVGTAPNKRANYVEIAASAISGDLPAPAKLTLLNNYNNSANLYDIWIGHNFTDPANALWNLEAEDASGGTPVVDAACSGGDKSTVSLSSDAELDLLTWSLSSVMVSAAKGKYVHALMRVVGSASISMYWTIRWRVKLKWGVTTIWQSEQVQPSDLRALGLRDLFEFRLPPWLEGMGSLDALSLVLTGQRTDETVIEDSSIDYLQLLPADGFRYITSNGYGVAYNSRAIDDGINGQTYRDNGADAARVGIFSTYGEPIQLEPNKLQRLYFLMHSDTYGEAEIARTLSVKASYRPRRRTL